MDYPRICPARWLSDQNFGMCMPHDFLYPFYDMHSYFRPWKCLNRNIAKEFSSTIENEKGNYKITVDVQHFRPNDISVRVSENEIIVEGKHEERPDTHGFISRQFKRRYALPSHCPAENVTSSMSSDGILTIIAEKRSSDAMEKIVPIKMCGTIPQKTQIEKKIESEVTQSLLRENLKETEVLASDSKNSNIKEEHSRLLKPELYKETVAERNGEHTASKQVNDIMAAISEKKETINIGATSTSNKVEDIVGKSNFGLSELSEQLCQRNLASSSEMCGINLTKTRIEESSSSYESSSSMTSTMKASGKIGESVSDIISAELREAAENI